ncbi:MAG TPA: nuclear transport factor 2 family protein [Pseudonocardia sp.]|jgi:predicted ester cyclase
MTSDPATALTSGVVALMRRYCEEFVNAHDPTMCARLMADDYRLHLAGRDYLGRAAGYEPAVVPLFAQFPDLHITMHEMLTDGDRLATRFTLRGRSTRHGGNRAAWGGVALYTYDGDRLTSVWVEEDHHLARVQLHSGTYQPPAQPAGPPDPWTAARPAPPSPGATGAASRWLLAGGDGRLGANPGTDALLVVGRRFAFHTTSATVHVAGMATIQPDGSVRDVSTFSDGGTP